MCENATDHRRKNLDHEPPRKIVTSTFERASTCRNDDERDTHDTFVKQLRRRSDESVFEIDEESRNFQRNNVSGLARLIATEDSAAVVPLSSLTSLTTAVKLSKFQEITNGQKKEANGHEVLTNGREMAPTMGVPPPPPAPHMGPDGLILPRKPYNPCLISNTHKDLRRELLFNQKVGRNVLNPKSELQIALDKQRETARLRELEKTREGAYKDDPRTALQRALEQRAKQIHDTEQQQNVEPTNPLMTARAKLRHCTDIQ